MIKATENAVSQIKKKIAARKSGIGIRVGVKTSGCSGLSYVMEFADEVSADDMVFEQEGGVSILVSLKNHPILENLVVDFVREGANEGFKFINPNAKAGCGCGKSFSV